MDDKILKRDVTDELDYDPSLDKADIGVSCQDGIVTLRGEAIYLGQKYAAEKAATRVRGVRAIANEITMRDPLSAVISDHDIAKRAADLLNWDTGLQDVEIQAHVSNGQLTLTGDAGWHFQRQHAENLTAGLHGVRSVLNHVRIKPIARTFDIESGIKKALRRNAEVEADSIHVIVQDGGTVVLQGDVNAWHEREIVTSAAWAASGVTDVIDQLTIG